MPRLFVAIPLPDEAKDRLVAVQPPAVSGMRLVGQQELHLTLHFLGEIGPQEDELARKALARVRANALTITLKGVGRFPPEGQPQVLWAGVEDNPALIALHRAIGTALTDAIGFHPEERPYSPHVTLARLNESVPPNVIDRYLEEKMRFVVPSVRLNRFAFYSSDFADNVPHYREKAVFPLHEHAITT